MFLTATSHYIVSVSVLVELAEIIDRLPTFRRLLRVVEQVEGVWEKLKLNRRLTTLFLQSPIDVAKTCQSAIDKRPLSDAY